MDALVLFASVSNVIRISIWGTKKGALFHKNSIYTIWFAIKSQLWFLIHYWTVITRYAFKGEVKISSLRVEFFVLIKMDVINISLLLVYVVAHLNRNIPHIIQVAQTYRWIARSRRLILEVPILFSTLLFNFVRW